MAKRIHSVVGPGLLIVLLVTLNVQAAPADNSSFDSSSDTDRGRNLGNYSLGQLDFAKLMIDPEESFTLGMAKRENSALIYPATKNKAKPWHNRTIAQPFEVNTMEADGNTEGKLQGCEIATRTLSRELEECEEEILTLAIKCDPVFSDGAVVIPEFGETQSRRNERILWMTATICSYILGCTCGTLGGIGGQVLKKFQGNIWRKLYMEKKRELYSGETFELV